MIGTLAGREQLVVQTRANLAGVDPATGSVLWKTATKAFQGMNILNPTLYDNGILTSSYGGATFFFTLKPAANNTLTADKTWQLGIQGYMSSPVVIDGYAYLLRTDHHLTCINLRDGKEQWTAKPGFGDYASFVTDGKNILALDQTGELFLIRHNPAKFELLDRKKISEEETWAHVAVCGKDVFVRELKAMAAYEWDGPG
jgi:outer membrane protein assembly factor BamB